MTRTLTLALVALTAVGAVRLRSPKDAAPTSKPMTNAVVEAVNLMPPTNFVRSVTHPPTPVVPRTNIVIAWELSTNWIPANQLNQLDVTLDLRALYTNLVTGLAEIHTHIAATNLPYARSNKVTLPVGSGSEQWKAFWKVRKP